jgi:hypothetical protein
VLSSGRVTDPATTPRTDDPGVPAGDPAAARDAPGPVRDARDRIELVAAVILAFAAILAAWSAYQATRWSGEQANAYNLAAARRTDAAQETSLFAAEALVEIQIWLSWLQLQRTEAGAATAAFLEERFREEFKPAFEAWLAQVPEGEIPPGTPFEMDEYESETADLVLGHNEEAEALADEARRANQLSDNFVLVTVIMAAVLFFAGVGTHFKDRRLRLVMLGFAVALLAGGVAFTFAQPQSIAV